MSRKQIVILVAFGVFVGVGIVIAIFSRKGIPGFQNIFPGEGTGNAPTQSAPAEQQLNQENSYSSAVPRDAKLTTPALEAPAAPNVSEKLGIFELKATRDGYSPSSITVKMGNLVQIHFTAVDGDYDFSMPYSGLYQFAKMGETKPISFGATSAGTFLFQCKDHCPNGSPVRGSIIVIP